MKPVFFIDYDNTIFSHQTWSIPESSLEALIRLHEDGYSGMLCITNAEAERRALMSSLSRTRAQINQAYGCFNQTSDGDLIESYVFEINALQARYNYLLRRLKQLGAQP